MKTAAKVFIWIGMICQFYLIFPVVVGIIALTKIKKATRKEDLIAIGVVTIIFCNALGGIFMLNIDEKSLLAKSIPQTTGSSNLDNLETLYKMKEEGLITEEEFTQKKQEILKDV